MGREQKKWTEEEESVLKNFYEGSGARYCLEFLPHRNENQVRHKARILGLSARKHTTKTGAIKHVWDAEQNAVLNHYYQTYGSRYCLQFLPEYRTLAQVRKQASKLGLERQPSKK